jgi:hypothetical protein
MAEMNWKQKFPHYLFDDRFGRSTAFRNSLPSVLHV